MSLEIEIERGILVKINPNDNTCGVIKSPKATGTVFIPRFVEKSNNKYKVTSIEEYAFSASQIDILTFPEDSEVEFFGRNFLYCSRIKKLKIPPKLKRLDAEWCHNIPDLTDIEVSPKNNNFIFYENNFLLGKSDENSNIFDVLYFARSNIEKAVIPAQVRVIKDYSFSVHIRLKSVTFPEKSELRVIENNAFMSSAFLHLDLPPNLEQLSKSFFQGINYLNDVEVSPENKVYRKCCDKYVVMESEKGSGVFDVLVFAPRNIDKATIPRTIRVISDFAFSYCKLTAVTFEANSSLESIGDYAFSDVSGLEQIVFPPSVRKIGSNSFSMIKSIKTIEFLGKSVEIGYSCFSYSSKLTSVIFPNAEHITIDYAAVHVFPDGAKLFMKHNTKLDGGGLASIEGKLSFIEEGDNSQEQEGSKTEIEKPVQAIETSSESKENKKDLMEQEDKKATDEAEERNHLKKFNNYLIERLSRYEEVPTFEEYVQKMEGEIDAKEYKSGNGSSTHKFVGADDEEFHEVVCKIGGGATSEVFKIRDTRTGETLCKKVIKECSSEAEFKMLQSAMKEIGAHGSLGHECVCRLLGFNLNEEVAGSGGAKTTVALFFELLQFSVRSVMQSGLMSNTLKARTAVEVCFGMSHIHACGMMHRDLKLDNVMMNGVFESKIIDFGLARGADASGASSLTTGVGTLAYMSPEMLNEEAYDAKTDVYSYGVVLFALFTGDVPKQKLRERMNNVPIAFPAASPSMSEYCIDLIRRCTSFDASQRPTFDEIADDMAAHSFALASEIDAESVSARFRELDIIRQRSRMQDS